MGGVVGAGAGYAIGKHIDNKKNARAAEAERAAAEANANACRSSSRGAAIYTAAGHRNKAHRAAGSAAAALPPAEAVALRAGYLPNPATGPAAAAYPASGYRCKSW